MWRKSKRSRVGVLRTALNKSSARLGNWHVQRLAAEDEKIPAVLQISFDRFPGIGRNSRSIRKHQQLGLLERAGDSKAFKSRKIGWRSFSAAERVERSTGWLATVGKPGCQRTTT